MIADCRAREVSGEARTGNREIRSLARRGPDMSCPMDCRARELDLSQQRQLPCGVGKLALQQIAQHARHLQPARGARRLDPAMNADRHVEGKSLHGLPIGSGTGLERSGGVLGDDGPGSEGGRMPASAAVSSGAAGGWISTSAPSGIKAVGGRMPASAPVSVSCFGT